MCSIFNGLVGSKFASASDLQKGADVAAGPSNTVVIDNQRMYWMAGKVRRIENADIQEY